MRKDAAARDGAGEGDAESHVWGEGAVQVERGERPQVAEPAGDVVL